MRRRALAALLPAVAVMLANGPAVLAAPSRAELLNARLVGNFRVTGVITAAVGVPGERPGRHVRRIWGFQSGCPALPCAAVGLIRTRARGYDATLLRRRAASYYTGSGTFPVAVRCGGRRYPTGITVPYTISLRITDVRTTRFGILVRAFRATYVGRARVNHTPCVVPAGHDAARYAGTLS